MPLKGKGKTQYILCAHVILFLYASVTARHSSGGKEVPSIAHYAPGETDYADVAKLAFFVLLLFSLYLQIVNKHMSDVYIFLRA